MNKLSQFLKFLHLSKFSFYLLVLLIIASFSITFYLLLPNNELVKDPINLQYILLADIIFVLLLVSIIIRQILLILIYKKNNYNESRLYIKFINLFTAMALGPAIGVLIITSLFFNLELRTWYGGAVKEVVVNSNIVARDYENEIKRDLSEDKNILISAHGNSLRALCKFLFKISDNKINELEIPTGNPLVIEFEKNLKVKKFFYLDEVRAKNIIFNQ